MESVKLNFFGYHVIEEIYANSRVSVYRASRNWEGNACPVVIKLLSAATPTPQELLNFHHQYTIAKTLDAPGIVRPYSLEPYGRGYAIIMEDFGGISLEKYAQSHDLSCSQVLDIGIQITNALQYLYQQRVVHKDLKPANILIHPTTKQVKLIDFSIASLLPHETQGILYPEQLEGTLPYLSPEQTGRMNRGIDYRTDFYALGITLYELLAGKLPFEAEIATELIYCHLAKQAIPIHEINPRVPRVVSQIVAKLMAKNAEDRYQSALGLKHDLEQCWIQWQSTGEIAEFRLGQRDLGDRFLIPEKLYGRSSEVQTLLQAFDRVSAGQSEIMLVSGFSGVGKTAVVNEVHKPITRQQGYFIKGKFDQFNSNIPLSAFVQALRDLVLQLLGESDAQLAIWKRQLLAALGENGQVLVAVLPELERIIGQQPHLPELSGHGTQNRFNLLVQKFIKVFTTPDHPLVIFLDDLQWADLSSLRLLQLLMQDVQHLLIVGAYRDNEVWPAHPLMLTLQEFHKTGHAINTIFLQPLDQSDTNQLIADTLLCDPARARSLAQLVYQKTSGNPFFTTQFLKGLYQDGLIQFNTHMGYWQCDISQIKLQSITDDVVAFMAQQLQKLPSETQQILQLAACVGAEFNLQTLAMVAECSETEAAVALWSALQNGLVIPLNQIYKFFQAESEISAEYLSPLGMDVAFGTCTYRFLHDRVQQAAYLLIPETQKAAAHLRIGRLLLSGCNLSSSQKYKPQLFQIVNQLNHGIELIDQEREQIELAHLNWQAGVKARASAAYDIALNYLNIGLQLLSAQAWRNHYRLSLRLHQQAAEVAYLLGNYGQMQKLIKIAFRHTVNDLDRAKFHEIHILALVAQNQFRDAIDYARNILTGFGVYLPQNPSKLRTTLGFLDTLYQMGSRTPQDLLALPEMTDPSKLVACSLMSAIGAAAQRGMPEIFPFITFSCISLYLRYGNISKSSMAYTIYAFLLCEKLGQIDKGYSVGQAAIALCHQTSSKEALGTTLFMWNRFVSYRKASLHSSLSELSEAYQVSLEVGDNEYAAYSLSSYFGQAYIIGQNLVDLKKEAIEALPTIAKLQQASITTLHHLFCQSLENLTTTASVTTYDPCQLKGVFFDETDIANQELQIQAYTSLRKLDLALLFHRYPLVLEQVQILDKLQGTLEGTFSKTLICFYDALARLAQYPHSRKNRQKIDLKKAKKAHDYLARLAKFAPRNYQHKVLLLAAERHRVVDEWKAAEDFYEQAIAVAKAHQYIQDEAFANELAARFYLDRFHVNVAAHYMQEAYYCYARWGAKAKLADLEQRYPNLLTFLEKNTAQNSLHHKTVALNPFPDLDTVLRAAQEISEELDLEKLLIKLMPLILKIGGATKGVLILSHNYQMTVVATTTSAGETLLVPLLPMALSQDIPLTLMNLVCHCHETAIIDEPQFDSKVGNDPYWQQHPVQSVLCMPLFRKGELVSLIYLENRFAVKAFTGDRLQILNFLCARAATALENAQLYQKLQQSEHQFRSLVENVNDIIYSLTPEGNFSYLSPRFQTLLGYETTDFVNQSFMSLIHADDLPALLSILQQIIESKENHEALEARVRHQNGDWIWLICNNAPILDEHGQVIGIHGIARDVTDRKSMEIALRNSEEHYSHLISNVPGTLYQFEMIAAGTYRMNYLSPHFVEMFEISAEDVLADVSVLFDLILPEDRAGLTQSLQNADPWVWEGRWVMPSGKIKWIRGQSNRIPTNGNTIIWDGILMDVTEQRSIFCDLQKAQEKLSHTNEQLELTNQELLRATRLKDEFLATMSHELRTPLNAILGMSEALKEEAYGDINERQRKSLSTIERSGRHLLSLINDILDVSKISAGKLELDISEVSILPLCNSSLTFIKQQAFDKKIQLDLNIAPGLGKIAVDERRIRQVLINLLSNAVKFTPNGGEISLSVSYQECDDDENWIDFAITDNGIGIDLADQEKLFKPFIQLDSRLNRQYAGTGLGLTLVKQIVELHDGRITLQSNLGQGSCFTMKLPHTCLVSDSDNDDWLNTFDTLSTEPRQNAPEIMQSALILLAEDNEANVETFSSYLLTKGYRLLLAGNGQEAIALAETQQPDLILMDIQMPVMDGIEAISWIRQNSRISQTPIIALTALAMEGDRERCLSSGANDYLTKPIRLQQLNLKIQEWLDLN